MQHMQRLLLRNFSSFIFDYFYCYLQKLPGKAEGWLSKTEFSDMSRIALPSILQQSTVSIGMMLVQSVVNSFGTQILAGFSAAMRIESLCVVPMSAIGNAMSSYTAQNIGAEKRSESHKVTGWAIS